jgi:hypothetical protein
MRPEELTSRIIEFEEGDMDQDRTVDLFQYLINTGIAWHLQGSYGRMAARMIEAGYCSPA